MINFINPSKARGIKWDINLFLAGLFFTLMNFFPVNTSGELSVVPQIFVVKGEGIKPDGVSGKVSAGEVISAWAPVEMEFNCGATKNKKNYLYCWTFAQERETEEAVLVREAEKAVVRFENSGKYHVRLTVNDLDLQHVLHSELITIVVNDPENPV